MYVIIWCVESLHDSWCVDSVHHSLVCRNCFKLVRLSSRMWSALIGVARSKESNKEMISKRYFVWQGLAGCKRKVDSLD